MLFLLFILSFFAFCVTVCVFVSLSVSVSLSLSVSLSPSSIISLMVDTSGRNGRWTLLFRILFFRSVQFCSVSTSTQCQLVFLTLLHLRQWYPLDLLPYKQPPLHLNFFPFFLFPLLFDGQHLGYTPKWVNWTPFEKKSFGLFELVSPSDDQDCSLLCF